MAGGHFCFLKFWVTHEFLCCCQCSLPLTIFTHSVSLRFSATNHIRFQNLPLFSLQQPNPLHSALFVSVIPSASCLANLILLRLHHFCLSGVATLKKLPPLLFRIIMLLMNNYCIRLPMTPLFGALFMASSLVINLLRSVFYLFLSFYTY